MADSVWNSAFLVYSSVKRSFLISERGTKLYSFDSNMFFVRSLILGSVINSGFLSPAPPNGTEPIGACQDTCPKKTP